MSGILSPDLQKLGAVIAGKLESQARTQQWLANQVKVSQPTISRMIQGRYNPDADVLYRIGLALSIDPLYLLRLAGLPIPDSPLDPTAAYIAQRISSLPPDLRERAMETVGDVVDTYAELAEQRGEGAAKPVEPREEPHQTSEE